MAGPAFIGRKDIAYTLRQKEALAWLFGMPILFFYFIGTVTAGFGGAGRQDGARDGLTVRTSAQGPIVQEFVRQLEAQDYAVRLVRQAGDVPLEGARHLTVDVPPEAASLERAFEARTQIPIRFATSAEGPAGQLERVRVGRAVYGTLAALAVAANRGVAPTSELFEELAATPRALQLEVVPAGRRQEIPSGFSQAIPGTMVMFTMLVLLTSGTIILVIERDAGLLRRLASTPIPARDIVVGKWAGKLCLALTQIGFALLVGTLLFGMDWGPSFPMVLLVLAAWAAFNASLAILVANLAGSQGQAAGVGVLATMVLAALGGCWWPIEITPAWMQALAMLLPTGWTMDAMHRLVNFGLPASSALPHLAAISLGAVVVGWFGVRTFRYQ